MECEERVHVLPLRRVAVDRTKHSQGRFTTVRHDAAEAVGTDAIQSMFTYRSRRATSSSSTYLPISRRNSSIRR